MNLMLKCSIEKNIYNITKVEGNVVVKISGSMNSKSDVLDKVLVVFKTSNVKSIRNVKSHKRKHD